MIDDWGMAPMKIVHQFLTVQITIMIMTSVVITTAVTFYGHNGHVHNDDVQ